MFYFAHIFILKKRWKFELPCFELRDFLVWGYDLIIVILHQLMWESWWGFDPQEKLVSKYNVACDGNFALASTTAFNMVTR